MFAPGDRIGVAVSGGADSVALLRLMEGMRQTLGITLAVVHFDHALRGAESDGRTRSLSPIWRERAATNAFWSARMWQRQP